MRKLSPQPEQPAPYGVGTRLALESLERLTPDRLSQFQIFSGVDQDELMLLAEKLEPASILAGNTLFAAGEQSHGDYLLLEGNLRLMGDAGETRELVARLSSLVPQPA